MSKTGEDNFVVTREYRRFAEFCDACRRYRYIGLCYGPPGVGKMLSARQYANWDKVEAFRFFSSSSPVKLEDVAGSQTVLYTPNVVTSPGQIEREVSLLRSRLKLLVLEQCWHTEEQDYRKRQAQRRIVQLTDWQGLGQEGGLTAPQQIAAALNTHLEAIEDPTTLILVDESDRLKMNGLEQLRALFDEGGVGLVLIGMPGLEKRLARYPQLYSRVGFVHEFHTLPVEEVRTLLEQQWKPSEVCSALAGITDAEVVASIVRITGGNFRLLHRLLTQIARMMEINALPAVTRQVVEAARENLVIGSV